MRIVLRRTEQRGEENRRRAETDARGNGRLAVPGALFAVRADRA
jgi:hypothetical protein